jgi:energy-coupling factor transporter ATP-binding protein EcfA2
MAARILIDRFSFRYGPDLPSALAEVSLDIAPGSCCAIFGPTGAGKTTLLHALVGILGRHHPDSINAGTIRVGERTFTPLPQEILFPRVGLVLQDPYVQLSGVRDTVSDEVLFTLENLGIASEVAQPRVAALLHELGIDHLATRQPSTLSGGETQRLALATMLIAAPEVLLLDEPTSALDTSAVERLRQIIESLHSRTTVIITDTQIDFSLPLADHIVVLDAGNLRFDGKPSDFTSRMNEFGDVLPVRGWREALDRLAESSAMQSHAADLLGKALGKT